MQKFNTNTNAKPENFKTLLKEITEDLNKWKENSGPWITKLNIIKIAICPKLIYKVNSISIKILASFYCRSCQADLKLIGKCKRIFKKIKDTEKE